MKKTLLASSIALAVGGAASVHAQSITITQMNYSGVALVASGTVNSNGDGVMSSVDNFFSAPWNADQQNWFDTHSSALIWSGTGSSADNSNAFGDFTYTFHLESNQVAVGTFFDWAGNNNIPILTIYDCPVTGGGPCIGDSLPNATFPLQGMKIHFSGTTNDDFLISGSVPIPAAAWLFGSGLLGLIGAARRKVRS